MPPSLTSCQGATELRRVFVKTAPPDRRCWGNAGGNLTGNQLYNEKRGRKHRNRTTHSHQQRGLTLLDFDQEGQKQQRKRGRTFENIVNFIDSLITHNLSTFYNIQRKHHYKGDAGTNSYTRIFRTMINFGTIKYVLIKFYFRPFE